MFTGIVQDVGRIAAVKSHGDNILITVQSRIVDETAVVGDSVAISGVCLTATFLDFASHSMTVSAVEETLRRTTIGQLRANSRVNLEMSLRPTDRMGGHFVQGHVDTVGKCESIEVKEGSWVVGVSFPSEFQELVVEKGSIAIDGVSLTAYEVSETSFKVSIIPHTLSATTFNELKTGDPVNLEFDILGKYVQRMLQKSTDRGLTMERLKNYGF